MDTKFKGLPHYKTSLFDSILKGEIEHSIQADVEEVIIFKIY